MDKDSIKKLDKEYTIKYEEIDKEYNIISKGSPTYKEELETVKNKYLKHHKEYGLLEEFPYHFYIKFWRITTHSNDYIEFYDNYDKLGITKDRAFFHYCKNMIYEFSSVFKEELIRQEALIRLLSGLFYTFRIGFWSSIIIIILHLISISMALNHNFNTPLIICVISFILCIGFRYTYIEIREKIRFMRVKELQIAFDSFFIISKRFNVKY